MPRPGYAQINMREEIAQKAKQEADKMGITLVEYMDLLINAAQTDRLVHESVFKGLLLEISNNLTAINQLVLKLQKEGDEILSDFAEGELVLNPSSVNAYVKIGIAITALTEDVLQPLQTLLYPLLGSLFPNKGLADTDKHFFDILKGKMFGSTTSIGFVAPEDLIKTLKTLQDNINRLVELFPDDKEIIRLYELLKPYAEKLDSHIKKIDAINRGSKEQPKGSQP